MKRIFHAIAALLGAMPLAAAAVPGLDPVVEIPLTETPAALAAADFDSDNDNDFLVASADSATLTVRFGDGAGGVDAGKPALEIDTDHALHAAAAGDFDGDGFTDIAALKDNGSAGIWLNQDAGDGTREFVESDTFAAPNAAAIAAGDFDGDGADDVVVANSADDSFSIFISTAGIFGAASEVTTGDFPAALEVANADGDTDDDLLVLNAMDGTLQTFLNDGATLVAGNTFQAASVAGAAGATFPATLATAQLDAGGDVDVVIGNLASNELYVLYGDGLGDFEGGEMLADDWHGATLTLQADTTLADPDAVITFDVDGVARPPQLLAFGDVSGDGNTDLVVSALGREAVLVFPGNGSGGFGDMQVFALPRDIHSLAVADLDSDAYADAVGISADGLHLLLNRDIANRAPVMLDRTLHLDECTRTGFPVAHDVDGDELAFDTVTITAEHPLTFHALLPELDVEAGDSGDQAAVTAATLELTVNDGIASSRAGTLTLQVAGNGTSGDCASGEGVEIGDLGAAEAFSIFAPQDLTLLPDAFISAPNITIDAGGDGSDGSCDAGASEGIVIDDGASGSITVGNVSSSLIGGDEGAGDTGGEDDETGQVAFCGDLVVADGEIDFDLSSPGVFELVAPPSGEDDAGDADAGDDNTGSQNDAANEEPEPQASGSAGGGAWFWLGLPLLLLSRRRG